ncbi:MAG: C-terminal helicase domain-containing protein, partial [Alphaproteobacteria bacterium]|nr:C-terminal helicase domain-containing protein [Alphaproteobacteria bacterium]
MNSKNIKTDKQVSADVIQGIVVVDSKCKRNALKVLLEKEKDNNAIIFCNRKREASALNRHLAKHDFHSAEIFKGMPNERLKERLDDFKNGKVKLLVCSDTAVKKLDIPKVSNVFNFDVPFNAKDYLQRAKHAGQSENIGKVFTIATPNDTSYLEKIAKLNEKEIVVIEHEGIEQVSLIRPDEEQEEKPEQKNTEKPQHQNKNKDKQQNKQQNKQQDKQQ